MGFEPWAINYYEEDLVYGLLLQDKSMDPFVKGSIAIVRKQEYMFNDNNLVIVAENDKPCVCRKIKKLETGVILQPYNGKEYDAKYYTDEEFEANITIMGIVESIRFPAVVPSDE